MRRRSLPWAGPIALVLLATAVPAIGAPSNDHCADATAVSTFPFVDTVDFASAGRDDSDPALCLLTGAPVISTNVWYAITPPTDTEVCVRVAGGDSPFTATVLPLEGGCTGHLLGYNFGYACDAAERFPVTAGTTIHVEVANNYTPLEPYAVIVTNAAADTDGDGVNDCDDVCLTVPDVAYADADADGIGDACDPCFGPGPDLDGDGRCGNRDGCDTIPDNDVPDSDYDGWSDACDTCTGYGPTDADGDGVCDMDDNCPSTPNPMQYDYDDDFLGDACDTCWGYGTSDVDGDGWCDGNDNCPTVPNPGQEDTDAPDNDDGDGIGDACDACPGYGSHDSDGDALCDEADNCPAIPNPDQRDHEQDGVGDVCDACPLTWLPGTNDGDGDGTPDFCDVCPEDAADSCPVGLACTQSGALARVGLKGWASLVGWTDSGACIGGFAVHPQTGALYTLTFDSDLQGLALTRIDAGTGHGTRISPLWGDSIGSFSGLTFRDDGRLYALAWRTSTLVTIDLTTARVDVVTTIDMTLRNPAGLVFDGSRLLMASPNTLVEVDLATGGVRGLVGFGELPYCSPYDTHVKALARVADGSLLGVLRCASQVNTSWEYVVRLDPNMGGLALASQNLMSIAGIVDPGLVSPTPPAPCEGCLDANDAACCAGDVSMRSSRMHLVGRKSSSRLRIAAVMENLAGKVLPPDVDLQLQLRGGTGAALMCERLGGAFAPGRGRAVVLTPPEGSSAVRTLTFTPSRDGDRAVVRATIVLPPGTPRPSEILLALRPSTGDAAQCALAAVR